MDRLPLLVILALGVLAGCEKRDVVAFLASQDDAQRLMRHEPGRQGKVGALIAWDASKLAQEIASKVQWDKTKPWACPQGLFRRPSTTQVDLTIDVMAKKRSLRHWSQTIFIDLLPNATQIEDQMSWRTPERQGTRSRSLVVLPDQVFIQDLNMPGRWTSYTLDHPDHAPSQRYITMMDQLLAFAGSWRHAPQFDPSRPPFLWQHDESASQTTALSCHKPPPGLRQRATPKGWLVREATWEVEKEVASLSLRATKVETGVTLKLSASWRILALRPQAKTQVESLPSDVVTPLVRDWATVEAKHDLLTKAGLLQPWIKDDP